jgi:hypothetical protein
MNVNADWAMSLLVYGMAPVLILLGGFLGWRRIRPHCRRYGVDDYHHRASQRRKFWGYE